MAIKKLKFLRRIKGIYRNQILEMAFPRRNHVVFQQKKPQQTNPKTKKQTCHQMISLTMMVMPFLSPCWSTWAELFKQVSAFLYLYFKRKALLGDLKYSRFNWRILCVQKPWLWKEWNRLCGLWTCDWKMYCTLQKFTSNINEIFLIHFNLHWQSVFF